MRSLAAVLLAFVLVSTLPLAAAEDPYYVDVNVHPPRGPHAYEVEEDCTMRGGMAIPEEFLLQKTLGEVRPQPDPAHPSVGGWFPDCVATGLGATCIPFTGCVYGPPVVGGHASYELSSGNYSIVLTTPILGGTPVLPIGLPPPPSSSVGISGNSGGGVRFDCLGCPPPPGQ